ncbi:hypothetical protein RFI_00422, partial [Reticulomyxa filosa]
ILLPLERHKKNLNAMRKKRHIDEQIQYLNIINPNALREFRTVHHKGGLREQNKKLKAARTATRPEPPAFGVGVGGRLGTGSYTQYVMSNREKNVLSSLDPRDTLLAWDKKVKDGQEDPIGQIGWTDIYNTTQPQKLFREPSPTGSDEESEHTNNLIRGPPEKKSACSETNKNSKN